MHGPNHPWVAEDGEHLRMTAAFVGYFPSFHFRGVRRGQFLTTHPGHRQQQKTFI